MKETKKIKVSTYEEESTINIKAYFGWILVSSQEINTNSTRVENRIDGVYNVTRKENYVNLIFSRETTMPHYDEIVKLEKIHEEAWEKYRSITIPKFSITTCILKLLCFIIPGVLYIKKCVVDAPKLKEERKKAFDTASDAMRQAQKLLDENTN